MFMDFEKNTVCPYCKETILIDAIKCKHCGSMLNKKSKENSLWVSIISLVLAIICILALFDDSEWDADTYAGFFSFSIASLMSGIISLHQKLNGRNIAITGIVLSSISLLLFIGLLFE